MHARDGVRIDPTIPEPLRGEIVAYLNDSDAFNEGGVLIDLVWETNEPPDATSESAIIRLVSAENLTSYEELTQYLAAGEVPISDSAEPIDIVETITLRRRGLITISAGILVSLAANDRHRLTPSEMRLLAEIAAGGTLTEIAERIHFTSRHVTRLWRSLRLKAGTNDRDAVIEFFRNREPIVAARARGGVGTS